MKTFLAVQNSTIWDVCLNTYGSFNNIVKLMVDSNFAGVNVYPVNQQPFYYDENLVYNLSAQISNTIKYATQ